MAESPKKTGKAPIVHVYGRGPEGLVFIPRDEALELACIWDALGSASTWGEFRSKIPASRYKEILSWIDDPKPRADDPFPGYDLAADGDYPEWPAQEMLRWVPSQFRTAPFGKVESSVLNGEFLVLDPAAEQKIVAAFRAAGFRCQKDAVLISRATGCSRLKWKKRSIPGLLRALTSSNDEVRRSAIEGLALRGTSGVPKLLEALKHEDEKIRSGVATALRELRPISETVIAALIEALKDESEGVFEAVCYTLATIGREAASAAPLLIEQWKRGTDRHRNAAGWALGHIGGDPALVVPVLIEGLQDPSRDLRLRGIYSLGQIGSPAVPFLIEALRRRDFDISNIAQAFARIGSASLDALSMAQTHRNENVRQHATKILELLQVDEKYSKRAIERGDL